MQLRACKSEDNLNRSSHKFNTESKSNVGGDAYLYLVNSCSYFPYFAFKFERHFRNSKWNTYSVCVEELHLEVVSVILDVGSTTAITRRSYSGILG